MIVAIIKIDAGGPLEEFRIAPAPADAVAAFCGEYVPPLDEADYLGIDTGWPSVQIPADGYAWAWDFGAGALVQIPAPSPDYRLSVQVLSGAAPAVVASTTWETVGGVILTPAAHGELAHVSAAMTGEAQISGSVEVRVVETDEAGTEIDLTPAPLLLGDTAGVYEMWALQTVVAPRGGRNRYTVQVRASSAGDSASVRFASMALVVDG